MAYQKLFPPSSSSNTSPIYVNLASSVLNVIHKYSDTHDLRMKLERSGVNSLFNINGIYKIPNTSETVSSDKTAGVVFGSTSYGDWFAPLIVRAVNNIDGDNPTSKFFTGGAHARDNSLSLSAGATARQTESHIHVDGRKVTSFDGYANFLDIYWMNYVQAYNTTKADNTGREVLIQNHHLHFDGYEWHYDQTLEFLEQCVFEKYYGLQAFNNYDFIHYVSSANKKWVADNLSTTSTDKNCTSVIYKQNSDRLQFGVDNTVGIGKLTYLQTITYNCFSSGAKVYFYLINGENSFDTGDVIALKGFYKFFSV